MLCFIVLLFVLWSRRCPSRSHEHLWSFYLDGDRRLEGDREGRRQAEEIPRLEWDYGPLWQGLNIWNMFSVASARDIIIFKKLAKSCRGPGPWICPLRRVWTDLSGIVAWNSGFFSEQADGPMSARGLMISQSANAIKCGIQVSAPSHSSLEITTSLTSGFSAQCTLLQPFHPNADFAPLFLE